MHLARHFGGHVLLVVLGEQVGRGEAAVGVEMPLGDDAGALAEQVRRDAGEGEPLRALMARNAGVDWEAVDDVIFGCANQAGEDNRNVARMSLLLAGLPIGIGGTTMNRLCGSGMDAVITAARAIKSGEGEFYIAGGVESMSRAPMVLPANTTAPEHTVTLSAMTRPGSSFLFAVERLASFGLLPSTTLS